MKSLFILILDEASLFSLSYYYIDVFIFFVIKDEGVPVGRLFVRVSLVCMEGKSLLSTPSPTLSVINDSRLYLINRKRQGRGG